MKTFWFWSTWKMVVKMKRSSVTAEKPCDTACYLKVLLHMKANRSWLSGILQTAGHCLTCCYTVLQMNDTVWPGHLLLWQIVNTYHKVDHYWRKMVLSQTDWLHFVSKTRNSKVVELNFCHSDTCLTWQLTVQVLVHVLGTVMYP